jgi:hypothetical protein
MDFILRHLNARGLLIFIGTGLALSFMVNFYDAPYRWYQDRHFAQERGAAPVVDIAADLDARESLKLKSLYRAVSAEITAAEARGRAVDALQVNADAALKLDAPTTRAYAIDTLNRIRLAIPQPLDAVRPSAAGDEKADSLPTPPSSAPKRARRRGRAR